MGTWSQVILSNSKKIRENGWLSWSDPWDDHAPAASGKLLAGCPTAPAQKHTRK